MITIKQAADITGLSTKAIRYYEDIGLVTPDGRTPSGYRMYSEDNLVRLRQIKFYRNLRFSISDIILLFRSSNDEILAKMEAQLEYVEKETIKLQRAKAVLDAYLSHSHGMDNRQGRSDDLAIIGIDLQNDILEGGALPCRRIEQIIPKLQKLYSEARSRSVPIIYICDRHKEGDPELKIWADHMMEGSWGVEIISSLAPEPQDYTVYKNLFNGFVNTSLQDVLDLIGAKTLLFTGWRTDICVAQTAIEAFYRGYRVIIAEDGVNSTSENEHKQGLSQMLFNYDFEMYACADVLEVLLG